MSTATATSSQPALLGGSAAITQSPGNLFTWPIITSEDEAAVLDVLRRGAMSGTDITQEFERKYAAWQGSRYALGHCNGTAALLGAYYGCGVGPGDEVICPSVTYWASATPAYALGATPVFAEIDSKTLCLDPADIEPRITKRTKAIVVVHYLAYPADMAPIMAIAKKHGIKVIEDVSHAQGGLYRGRRLGTFGDVSAASLMSGKSLPAGEAGMLTTDNLEIYERAVAFGHYERYVAEKIQTAYLKPWAGLPLGGVKHRMHQMSAAVGLVQLKYNDARCAEIRRAINRFWDMLEGVPGLRPHRTDPADPTTNMAGWYAAHGLYVPEELGGLSVTRFCEAVRAEGFPHCEAGFNCPLHTHPLFIDADVYGHGRPTRLAHSDRDVSQAPESLPRSVAAGFRTYSIPWFKHDQTDVIRQYADAYRKVAENADSLRQGDPGDPPRLGGWHFFRHR